MQAATTQPMLRQVLTPKSENRFLGCAIDPIIQPTRPATRDQDAIVPGMVFLSAEGAQNQLQSLWATVNSSMRSTQGAWIPQVTPPDTQYLMAMPRTNVRLADICAGEDKALAAFADHAKHWNPNVQTLAVETDQVPSDTPR